MTRQETINKMSEVLKTITKADSWIFGSSARGDYHENSDIDVLILIPDSLSSSERIDLQQEIAGLLWEIEMESGFEISPVILQHKIWNQRISPFTINVINDRIRI